MATDGDATPSTGRQLLGQAPGYRWSVDASSVDMSMSPPVRRAQIVCTPQNLTIDLSRTALIVIDMQNDFCSAVRDANPLAARRTKPRQRSAPQFIRRPIRQSAPRKRFSAARIDPGQGDSARWHRC